MTSLADPASVVATGAAFQKMYDVLSCSVCVIMMTIFMMDIMTITWIF